MTNIAPYTNAKADGQTEDAKYLFKQTGKIDRNQREVLNQNRAFTLWFTGLSGSGKSTLASELEYWIYNIGGRVYILDGDNIRLGINSDLSFEEKDRSENVRRVAELAHLFNDAGIIIIASFISPFAADRAIAKLIIGERDFIEVYVDASLSSCKNRDPKGLYKLAEAGKVLNFTGVSSPYEPPLNAAVHVQTDHATVELCLNQIKQYLVLQKFISIG